MQKSHQGSCHCGAVRFRCELDLAAGTSRCNCSICTKGRFWKAIVKADAFELLQGADSLTGYQFDGGTGAGIHHMFCKRCGIKPFGRGRLEGLGDFYGINIACLDDATDQELAVAPVSYEDGRHNKWESPPAETRHL